MADSSGGPRPRMRLAQARNDRRWSQQDVAEKLGTTYVNVSRWERGITRPSPYFRRKLCGLYGKSEEDLDLILPPATSNVQAPEAVATGAQSVSPEKQASSPSIQLPPPPLERVAIYDPTIPLRPATPLVGREAELDGLRGRLKSGGSVALTALNGLPGVGKTTLAITLAHDGEMREHFRDGILWCGLGPEPNIRYRLSRWATLLGVSATEMAGLHDDEAWALSLRAAIGTRAMLLVIDDAWEVNEALAFKVGGPNCAHLVTTRFPHIAAHVAADGATIIRELDEEQSLALLRLLAPQVIEKESRRAQDLIQAVGGLPLALTLMGNFLRLQSYSGQVRRINAALERLSDVGERLKVSEPRGPIERHPSLPTETTLSLQSVIAVTDQQLPTEARETLYALSVLPAKPNSFSEEAALAVANCTYDTIDMLSDSGLLESGGEGRYTLHQTIADYARLRLQENAPHERLIAYAGRYIEEHKSDYELLDLESGTILAALDTAQRLEQRAELVQLLCAFAPFLLLRGNYALAERHTQHAHQAARTLNDQRGIISTLLYLGQIAQKQGNYASAESQFKEGLTLAREINDTERISALLRELGWIAWRQGNFSQAEIYLQEGLTLANQINNSERISSILEILGSIASNRGDYSQSEIYIQEALKLARQNSNREQICVLLIHLGVTNGEQGRFPQAEQYLQEGLVLARQIGHKEWISALLANLGDVAINQGQFGKAETYFQEGLTLAQQIGQPEWICVLLCNLGLTARKQGHYKQAEPYLIEGLEAARKIGIPQMSSNALYECGNLYFDQKNLESAETAFREMLDTTPKESSDLIALAQYGLARVADSRGNRQEAYKLGSKSAEALEAMGHRNADEVRAWLTEQEKTDR